MELAEKAQTQVELEKAKAELAEVRATMREAEREVERKAFRVINHTSKRVMANTAQLSTYAVDFCRGVCGTPPTGNQINDRDGGQNYYAFTIDMISTGTQDAAAASSQLGAFLMGMESGDGCNGLVQ